MPYFYEHLSAESLLRYFGEISGLKKSEIKVRSSQVLTLVGLDDAKQVELRRFSKGMLQRIGIAQALLKDPEILIMDEPMSGLDPVGRKEVRELILRLSSQGKTIFFSSHVISDVDAVCSHFALLRKGKLIQSAPIHEAGGSENQKVEISFRVNPSRITGENSESYFESWPEFENITKSSLGVSGVVSGETQLQSVLSSLVEQRQTNLSVITRRSALEEFLR
jgi:ABC-2 type transport system ATP-binding protein